MSLIIFTIITALNFAAISSVLVVTDTFGSVTKSRSIVRNVESYVNLYALNEKIYPKSLSELKNAKNSYSFDSKEFNFYRDEWGQELLYNYPSKYGDQKFDLYSIGPNGIDEHGTGDDIASWKLNNGSRFVTISAMDIFLFFALFVAIPFLLHHRRKKLTRKSYSS